MSDSDRIEVVYDKECPICEFYCQRIDIRESVGELVRVDARDDSEIMSEITALGLDTALRYASSPLDQCFR